MVKDSIPKLAKCFLGHEVLDPEPLDIVGGAAGQLTPSAQDAEVVCLFFPVVIVHVFPCRVTRSFIASCMYLLGDRMSNT